MVTEMAWTNDWETFVNDVGELFRRGLDNNMVSERFAGKRVVWKGTVAGKRLGIARPGIQMTMPAVNIDFPDGKRVTVDFLFLTLRAEDLQFWLDTEVGATLRFATQIRRSSGPFPGIECSRLDEDGGVILFLTDGAIPLND
jgi:hypothetical protein